MADIHHMALHVSSTDKKKNGMPLYKVHKVGSSLGDRIKPGEHLNDTELDDAQEMGAKLKHMKEDKTLSSILDEARGRPRKVGGPTDRREASAKAKTPRSNDDEDDSEPDVGPEADQNITVHLKKTIDNNKHETNFSDGSKHVLPQHVAKSVHDGMMSLRPDQRKQVQDHIQKSHKNLMDVHTMLKNS